MYSILMILAILVNTLPRFIHGIYLWDKRSIYYVGQALSFVLVILAQKVKKNTEVNKAIYRITLWVAMSNLIDELFFDPVSFGANEIWFAIFIIIMSVYKSWMRNRTFLHNS